MSEKKDAVDLLDSVVALSEQVTAKARAAQDAIAAAFANLAPPPERNDQ